MQLEAGLARNYIDGEWVTSVSGRAQPCVNPATGQVLANVPVGDREDARRAVDAAVRARETAGAVPAHRRYKNLLRVAQLLEEHRDEMARLIAMSVGKPIADAEVETNRAILVFTFAAEEAKRLYGETIPLDAYPLPAGNENRLAFTMREPIGVVVAISPFNFPLNLLSHKVGPALAAGNAVVAKPPSDGPLPALKLAELIAQTDFPKGMFNVVTGPGGSLGMELVTHPEVNAVTFTGDTTTGRLIAEKAAQTNKRVILELGGHDPFLVLDDADVNRAVVNAVNGVFTYQGQVCAATKRIITHEKVHDTFVDKFARQTAELKVGDPLDRSTRIGPVINERALHKIQTLVTDAADRGARIILGGHRLNGDAYAQGYYYAPTVLDSATTDMRVCQEEIFGPAAPILVARDDEEAIRMANQTIYGLQAAVFSRDLARAIRVARRIRAGGVLVNDRNNLRWDNAPFGGMKQSGMGREGVRYAVQELTELKLIVANLAPDG
jgi:acyl-CoA reductase-like NAD-dependent aldehyde dehydrogenase